MSHPGYKAKYHEVAKESREKDKQVSELQKLSITVIGVAG